MKNDTCPKCMGNLIVVTQATVAAGLSQVPTQYALCGDCKTVWEAYPANWQPDVCEKDAEPCDNCAFRPGAPEHKDKKEWAALRLKLQMGGEFRCHKGAPIVGATVENLTSENPKLEFDREWVEKHGRGCVGFWRMIWAKQNKDPSYDWFKERYENPRAPGFDLPLPEEK